MADALGECFGGEDASPIDFASQKEKVEKWARHSGRQLCSGDEEPAASSCTRLCERWGKALWQCQAENRYEPQADKESGSLEAHAEEQTGRNRDGAADEVGCQ